MFSHHLCFSEVIWIKHPFLSFFGLGSEEKWYAALAHEPDGLWNKVADEMLDIFADNVHPAFTNVLWEIFLAYSATSEELRLQLSSLPFLAPNRCRVHGHEDDSVLAGCDLPP